MRRGGYITQPLPEAPPTNISGRGEGKKMKYCKICKNAKEKIGHSLDQEKVFWFCGKHRKWITQHTLNVNAKGEQCKDYEEEK